MDRVSASVALCLGAAVAFPSTANAATDFGVRVVGGLPVERMASNASRFQAAAITDIHGASRIAGQFGRVTSTLRSVAHNRAVGGVANSYHLRGRAVDVARRRDVSHWEIASALREAGFHLLESLDEGDHSHFAFSDGRPPIRLAPQSPGSIERTIWRIVVAPPSTEPDPSG